MHNRPFVKAAWSTLVMALVVSSASAQLSREIDWSFAAPEDKPVGIFGNKGLPLSIQSMPEGGIVSDSTVPANPFPELAQSLYVGGGDNPGAVRIRLRPFESGIPESGEFEMAFRLVEGTVNVGVGVVTQPWDPNEHYAYYISEKPFFTLGLPINQTVSFRARPGYTTTSLENLKEQENYTLKIVWKKSGEQALDFQFFLNGEQIMDPAMQPFVLKAEFDPSVDPSLGFIIQTGSQHEPPGKFFLGKITVK